MVLAEYTDGWRLTFGGVEGSGSGDSISGEKAKAILGALTPPYESASIQAAVFYDDFRGSWDSQLRRFRRKRAHLPVNPRLGRAC